MRYAQFVRSVSDVGFHTGIGIVCGMSAPIATSEP
jgi:hypothetical protein